MSYELAAILLTTAWQTFVLFKIVRMIHEVERWRDRIDAALFRGVGDIHEILARMAPERKQ